MNGSVMAFRLGFEDGRLHTLLEIADRFDLSEDEARELERRFLGLPGDKRETPMLKRLAFLGLYERQVLAYRLGIGEEQPHTLAETAQRFRMDPGDVARLERRLFGLGEPTPV